jgi:hypothetical protein
MGEPAAGSVRHEFTYPLLPPSPSGGVFGRKLIVFNRLRTVCVAKYFILLHLRLNIRF